MLEEAANARLGVMRVNSVRTRRDEQEDADEDEEEDEEDEEDESRQNCHQFEEAELELRALLGLEGGRE